MGVNYCWYALLSEHSNPLLRVFTLQVVTKFLSHFGESPLRSYFCRLVTAITAGARVELTVKAEIFGLITVNQSAANSAECTILYMYRHRNQQVTDAASPRTGSFQWTLPDWDITQPPRTEAVFLLSLSPNIVEVSQERGALCLSSLAVRSRSLRCSGNRARTRKYFLLKTWPSFPQITENRWVFIQWGQLLFSTLPWWNTFFLYV